MPRPVLPRLQLGVGDGSSCRPGFFHPPSPWHPGGFFLQPDVPVPKIPLQEMLRASGCSGNRQSWQVPPGGVRNTPAGLLTAQSMGRACVRQIFPQTSPALQRAHWKKKRI